MSTERTPLDFIPSDTLFCRDQRPLSAGSGYGHGANWPLPTVLHSAIRTALLRAAGDLPTEKQEGYHRNGKPRGEFGSTLFNWLNIHGPFPVKPDAGGNEQIYFPRPLDLVPKPEKQPRDPEAPVPVSAMRVIDPNGGRSNLPAPLQLAVASSEPPTKASPADWVPLDFYNSYLAGKDDLIIDPLTLWDSEHRINVEIDPETGAAREGHLFAAEHLRLRPDVRLRFSCSAPPVKELSEAECTPLSDALPGRTIHLGGESRFGLIEPGQALALPSVEIKGIHVKWVLLTPAIFVNGWLPGWIDAGNGTVMLKTVDRSKRRELRRKRREWNGQSQATRHAGTDAIAAKLVAACVGKPQVVGGWDLLGEAPSGTPKATHLAVPSGSVYYFKADSPVDAQRLLAALQARCRSDFFGEKGLGLGVCGIWQPHAGKGDAR